MASSTASNGLVNGKKRRKKARLERDARIVIIGSGLGGLGAAISLQQAGFTNVSLYERDAAASSRREGYGLTLTYNPKGPLAQMGVLEEVAQKDCPSRSHYIFSPDGSILGYYGNAFSPNRGKGQRGNLRVPRQVLRRILLNRIPSSSVHWGKKLVSFQQNDAKIQLEFQDGTVVDNVDLLVGADGIRSSVVKNLLGTAGTTIHNGGLRFLRIMIILGIADFIHPLLDERGFYSLDGTHRLFTMPYQGSKLTDAQGTPRRIMWQLSYRLEDEAEAQRLSHARPEALRDEVLRRCSGWHEPVVAMVKATPLETIWGTGLMDRDPQEFLQQLDLRSSSPPPRVVALGDAVHSMSPFKGMGANQALMDGPLLASWLQNASIDSAVRSFWREMVQRTSKVVKASRQAAVLLHSQQCLQDIQDFAGVKPDCVDNLLVELTSRGIGASEGGQLDELVQTTIDELGYGNGSQNASNLTTSEYEKLCIQAIILSANGDIMGLRNLSLKNSEAICNARDVASRTCLHYAVVRGHYSTCQWLLTEAGVPADHAGMDGKTALQLAVDRGREDIRELFMDEQKSRGKVGS